MHFPHHLMRSTGRATWTVRDAHDLLRTEMEDWMYERRTARIIIKPDVPRKLPAKIDWSRWQKIVLAIDYRFDRSSASLVGV